MRRLISQATIGENTKFFLGKSVAYSDSATFADFITEAVVGEIGVFNAASVDGDHSKAVLQTTALGAGGSIPVFIAERMADHSGEKQFRTFDLSYDKDVKYKKLADFAAPVSQVSFIGYDGNAGDIEYLTIERGAEYSIKIQDKTPRNEPLPTWTFNYVVNSDSETITDVITALVSKINEAYVGSNIPLTGIREEPIPIQAADASGGGSFGISFTGDEGISFNVSGIEGLVGSPVNYDNTGIYAGGNAVLYKEGSGHKSWMENAEYEGNVFEGATTQNDEYGAKYGLPTELRNDTLGYDLIYMGLVKVSNSKGIPNSVDHQVSALAIAAPTIQDLAANPDYANVPTTPSPITALKTIFGL